MSGLQVLKKRYKNIQATGDMASAMRTIATVKFSKLSGMLSRVDSYAAACGSMLTELGNASLPGVSPAPDARDLWVLLSSDRGFCGAFNSELLRYFETELSKAEEPPLLWVSGKKGEAFCRTRGITFEPLTLPEIPSYADAQALTEKLYALYAAGKVREIRLIVQSYKNMMTQIPLSETVLPLPANAESAAEEPELLYLPDRETALENLGIFCLTNRVYKMILAHQTGAQAATTAAMRSACDNVKESLEKLGIAINRIRQAEVTNSVIEISSAQTGQDMEEGSWPTGTSVE